MIDRNLNFGRTQIKNFIKKCGPVSMVLDLGAGKGADLFNAKELLPAAELLAVEAYPPYIQFLESSNVKVYPVNIECQKLPFEDNSIDLIIINQVFEHVKEVFWILHEISRVMKVGGHLIVGVPNLSAWHNRLLLLLGMQPSCIKNNSAHVRGYTRSDFKSLLNSGHPKGFKIIETQGANFYPFPPALAIPLAKTFTSLAVGIFMLIRKEQPYTDNGFLTFPVTNRLETNFFLGEKRN